MTENDIYCVISGLMGIAWLTTEYLMYRKRRIEARREVDRLLRRMEGEKIK
jgi:pilus assembly protein TadC